MNTRNSDRKKSSDNSCNNSGSNSVRDPVNSSRKKEMKSPSPKAVASGESSKPQRNENPQKPGKTLRPPFRSVPFSSTSFQKNAATNNILKEDEYVHHSTSEFIPASSSFPRVHPQKEGNPKQRIFPLLRSVPAAPRNTKTKSLPGDEISRNNRNFKPALGKTSCNLTEKHKKNQNESRPRYGSLAKTSCLKSPEKLKTNNSSCATSSKRTATQERRRNVTNPQVNAVLAEMRATRNKRQPIDALNSVQLCQNKVLPLPLNDPLNKSARKRVPARSSKPTKVNLTTKSPSRNALALEETIRRTPISNSISHSKTSLSRKLENQTSKSPPFSEINPRKKPSLSSKEGEVETSGQSIRGNNAILDLKCSSGIRLQDGVDKKIKSNYEAAKNRKKTVNKMDTCFSSSEKKRISASFRNETGFDSDSRESHVDSKRENGPFDERKRAPVRDLPHKSESTIPPSHPEKVTSKISPSSSRSSSEKNNKNCDTSVKMKTKAKTPTLKSGAGKHLHNKTIPRRTVAGKSLLSARAVVSQCNASRSSDEYETVSSSGDEGYQNTSDSIPRTIVAGICLHEDTFPVGTETRQTAAGKTVAGKTVAGKTVAGKSVAGKFLPSAAALLSESNSSPSGGSSSSASSSSASSSSASTSSFEYETATPSGDDMAACQSRSRAGNMSSVKHTKHLTVSTAERKNVESQKESDCSSASQSAKNQKHKDRIRSKKANHGGIGCLNASSAPVSDEVYRRMREYENRRHSSRTKCSKQLLDQNRTGYVASVRQEFFLEMEYYLYLQRRFEDESNESIRDTLLNEMRSFMEITSLRSQGLKSLGAELEHKNYSSWKNIFQVKKASLERRMEQMWYENFRCVVDSLQKEYPNASGTEWTLILKCDHFMFLKRNWILLKEMLDLIDRSASDLFSIQDEGAGCQLQ